MGPPQPAGDNAHQLTWSRNTSLSARAGARARQAAITERMWATLEALAVGLLAVHAAFTWNKVHRLERELSRAAVR